jgi:hypothetical protein
MNHFERMCPARYKKYEQVRAIDGQDAEQGEKDEYLYLVEEDLDVENFYEAETSEH